MGGIKAVAFIITILMVSGCDAPPNCENRPTCGSTDSPAAQEAFRRLYKAVVATTCARWEDNRADAIGDLFDAMQDMPWNSDVEGQSLNDFVAQTAWEVKANDCVKAGYPYPGPDRPRRPIPH
jgi:hypothetical protein